MKNPEDIKLALIGPSFFSYLESIVRELRGRGIFAIHFDERHSNGVFAKIMYRLGIYNIFTGKKRRHLKYLQDQIAAFNITHVLLVDVEVCDRHFVDSLIKSGVKVSIYMWDSAKNKPNFLKYLNLIEAKSSFDPIDCDVFGLTYIPLFAEFSSLSNNYGQKKNIDIYFCGTLHSNRPKIINQVAKFAKNHNLKFSSYNYYHNRLLFFIKSLVQVSGFMVFKTVTNKSLSKKEIYKSMASTKYVLDLQHKGQKGLTARTFEALRSGAYLITTNEFALTLPYGLDKRVIVLLDMSSLEGVDFDNFIAPPLTSEQDYYLSLNRFVDDIASLMSIK